MTFLDFIQNNQQRIEDNKRFYEAFNEKDMEKANKLMLSIFNKKIEGSTVIDMAQECTSDKKDMLGYRFINLHKGGIRAMWSINYLKSGSSTDPYSIDFFIGDTAAEFMWYGKAKSTFTIYTLGSSVAYFIPVICHIVNSGATSLSQENVETYAKEIFGKKTNESRFWIGAYPYTVLEGLSDSIIEDAYFIATGHIQEADDELKNLRWKKKAERDEAFNNRKESPEAMELYKKIDAEYKDIINAIRGGANSISDLKFTVKSGVTVEDTFDEKTQEAEKELKKQKEDPETSFKKMQIYVKSVIKGLQPGVILCGAPGIGKTYRVKQQLKAAGYHEGHNMYTIKGNASARQLYIDMYEYKDKGNIIVIDDADALVGAKAPEVAINILKAALDSTSDDEGRLVSYKVSGDLKDDEGVPIPKRMYVNCGVIIITNYQIGELDTALRGRVFTQSLDFDTEQVLSIIKGLIPAIDPVHLSSKAKMKAYDYLVKLNEQGARMEISIRTFASAARLYQLCEGEDMPEEQINEMIEEQMKNQALRKKDGKHF